jgi:putative ABC transport system substrate-binding protein
MQYRSVGVILLLSLALLQIVRAENAPPPRRVPLLGVLYRGFPPSEVQLRQSPLWQAMHELGWVEGQNITVERRYAEGHNERLRGLATELVQRPVDLILAVGPHEARAAKAASDTIPIVFMDWGDPVGAGAVASLAHPGGNMTGLSMASPELIGKRLELLTEAAPGISRVAVLTNADVNYLLPEMAHTAQQLGVTLHPINVPAADQLDHVVAALSTARAEALLVLPSPLFSGRQIPRVLELAATSRLPTIYPFRNFVAAGGLMSYGPSLSDRDRRVAIYVDKVLKGAKPADLPVEQPMNFELVINLKTAQALGITVPSLVLFQATEVIK